MAAMSAARLCLETNKAKTTYSIPLFLWQLSMRGFDPPGGKMEAKERKKSTSRKWRGGKEEGGREGKTEIGKGSDHMVRARLGFLW